jgi:hypothetical protein
VLLTASVVALGLAMRGVVLAAPTPQLIAPYLAQAAPTGPDDAAWTAAPVVDVPLLAQVGVPSGLPTATVPSARLRALHDGQAIYFLVEWADPTRDAQAIRPDQFRDAVALQFGVGDALPAICMGAPAGLANLWHWKADWQEDIDKGFQELPQVYPNFFKEYYPYVSGTAPYNAATDFASDAARAYLVGRAVGNPLSQPARTSPVEELLAAGFGSATSKTVQNVNGKGVWSNGTWRVMFSRPLTVQDTAAPAFAVGKTFSIAVAVWNGANQEVGSRKQTSSFVTLAIGAEGVTPAAPAAPAKPATTVTQPTTPAPAAGPLVAPPVNVILGGIGIFGVPILIWFTAVAWLTRRRM